MNKKHRYNYYTFLGFEIRIYGAVQKKIQNQTTHNILRSLKNALTGMIKSCLKLNLT